MTLDVMGLGFAAMDLVLNTEDLPEADGFSFVHGERLLAGGSCANAMAAVSRMGGASGLIAKVGDDHYGKTFVQDLQASGVSSSGVCIKPGGTTLHNFIAVTKDGTKAIFSHLGDSLLSLSDDDVSMKLLKGIKAFYNEMIPAGPALKLSRMCRESGIPVVFNLQVGLKFMALCGVSEAALNEMLAMCDLFITNGHFMMELAGKDNATDAARAVYETYRPSSGLIVTRGAKGSLHVHETVSMEVPSLNIRPVDTTGAGDAFSGGFLYGKFIKGLGMWESLQFATACAALKCTQPGPRLNATETDIRMLLGEHSR